MRWLDSVTVLLTPFGMPVVSLLTAHRLFADPGQARRKLRGWKETRGAIGTADAFTLSWGHSSRNTASLLADAAAVAAATLMQQ